MRKVVVLLSGGIDSAFAAYLLKSRGFGIFGLVLKIYDNVPSFVDLQKIEKIKETLKMEVYELDVREQFKKRVVEYFINSYLNGKTPNPCAVCNPEIKFRFGFEFMKRAGYDFVASGHYADKGIYKDYLVLKKAKDKAKSQEYFLARLSRTYLEKILFPLSSYFKEDVRLESLKIFPFLEPSRESQDVCFLRGARHEEFFKNIGISAEGKMLYKGKVVREKVNLLKYTRGQRKGIGFAAGERVYVKGIDVKNKMVLLGKKDELLTREFYVKNAIFYVPYHEISTCEVKVRYSQTQTRCRIKKIEGDKHLIELETPLYTVTPGQLAVFYDGDYVLGSGWIEML